MPRIFQKILCPIAFDANSGAAIEFAEELADPRMSISLSLLYVLSAPTVNTVVLEQLEAYFRHLITRYPPISR